MVPGRKTMLPNWSPKGSGTWPSQELTTQGRLLLQLHLKLQKKGTWTIIHGLHGRDRIINQIVGWATTQGFNFGQQLDAGIRYFDFRVQKNSPCNLKIMHALKSVQVADALKQFNSWLNAKDSYTGAIFNDKELLLLDFWIFKDITIDDHHYLCNLLISTFNDKFILYNDISPRNVTVDSVWEGPKKPQIIYFYAWKEIEEDKNYNKYI